MIGFFPEFYPDELVFSACSRYHERMAYRSRESTIRDLFNKKMVKVAIDFPSNLEALVQSFPCKWKTVEQLIDHHTLIPFYGPFVPSERLNRIREDMRGNHGGSIHSRLGVLTHAITSQSLRFCSVCVAKDRTAFGETYWHRLHQLPGIDVCPYHKVFLEETTMHLRRRHRNNWFVTAEQAVRTVSRRCVDEANHDHRTHLLLAGNARWLLEHPHLRNDASAGHRERYFALFYAHGFSGYCGRVKITALCEQIKQHYSRDLLDRFRCGFEKQTNWVKRVIYEMRKSQHTVEHLLIIQFLGVRAQDFFKLPAERLPFGEGPSTTLLDNDSKEPKDVDHLIWRDQRRRSWKDLLKKNPNAVRSLLRNRYRSLFKWLTKNDRDWFEIHLPPRKKPTGAGFRTNWPEQDKRLSQAIHTEAYRIRTEPGKPVRISGTRVAKNLGKLEIVHKRGDLVPLTKQALADVSESVEEYAVRRVRWAAKCFRAEGVSPPVWKIQTRASVGTKTAKHPLVRAALEASIDLH